MRACVLRLAIEDETDEVTNTCDAGDVPIDMCKRRVALLDEQRGSSGGAANKDET